MEAFYVSVFLSAVYFVWCLWGFYTLGLLLVLSPVIAIAVVFQSLLLKMLYDCVSKQCEM